MSGFQRLLSAVKSRVNEDFPVPHPDVEEGGFPEDLTKVLPMETIQDVERLMISPETGWESREQFFDSTGVTLDELVGSYIDDPEYPIDAEPPPEDTLQEIEDGIVMLQIVHNRVYLEDFQAWKDQEGSVFVDMDKIG